MARRRTDQCRSTGTPCYPQTLKDAIDRHLPRSLFQQHGGGGARWCERYLAICALLMAWSACDALADRFDAARRGVALMFPGRRRPGRSYQGFVAALAARSDALLARVADHLRGQVRQAAEAGGCWAHRGFVPIGADGSKVQCPRTAANEAAFGCGGKKKSTPQQFVTTLLHLPTGVVWQFATGPATASERQHLRQMLPTLPPDTLLVADAGFTGYDLLTDIGAAGHAFLIRVGANVRLLRKLGYALEERGDTVYLWPDGMQERRRPPLALRLITLVDGRNRRMHLLTGVTDESRLSDAAACEFYAMRWGVELHYRALKQTLARRKLASAAPATARLELHWAMAALWLLCLAAADAIARSAGGDVRRLSVATALRHVRKAMAAPTTRSGSAGLGRQLAKALKDSYVRTGSKRSRDWAHKKKPKPIGEPKARIADEQEIQLALELRRLAPAA